MSTDPAGGGDEALADFVAQRGAELVESARAARDRAVAEGTLVWDPFDPAWVQDPYAVYAKLRAENPVHRNALGFWVFTRHADCLAMLRDRRAQQRRAQHRHRHVPRAARRRPALAAGERRRTGGDGALPLPRPSRPHPLTRPRPESVHASRRGRPAGAHRGDLRRAARRCARARRGRPRRRLRLSAAGTDHRGHDGCPRRRPRAVPGRGHTRWHAASTPTSCSRPTPCSSAWGPSSPSCSTSPTCWRNVGVIQVTTC